MSDDLVKLCKRLSKHAHAQLSSADLERIANRIEELEKRDREAATHVEVVIAMRTGFTGDPPYVGWRGLGLALNEALDARDELEAKLAKAVAFIEFLDENYRHVWGETARLKIRTLHAELKGGKADE
jgi:hypothetical protein